MSETAQQTVVGGKRISKAYVLYGIKRYRDREKHKLNNRNGQHNFTKCEIYTSFKNKKCTKKRRETKKAPTSSLTESKIFLYVALRISTRPRRKRIKVSIKHFNKIDKNCHCPLSPVATTQLDLFNNR